jgi:DNA-binding transcriptional LysR family regulator
MSFVVTFVEGVTLDKWRRRWDERVPDTRLEVRLVDVADQLDAVRDGSAAMGFVRDLTEEDGDGLHHIPLYREVPVVVAHREHPVAAYDEIELDDLAGEIVLDDPNLETRLKIETVAAGTGLVFLPMSVARVHHRKDVVVVPVVGLPESQIGLAWRAVEDPHPLVETFIGIVRGRTARSSRGETPRDPSPPRTRRAGTTARRTGRRRPRR